MVQGHAHPAIRAAVSSAPRARHALRRHHRGGGRGRRGARAPLRSAALALHELGHRVEHGGHPARPAAHRTRRTREDGAAPTTGTPTSSPCTRWPGATPPRSSGASPLEPRSPARLRDHGGRDDERRADAPRARLPGRRPRADPPSRSAADPRRGQDRPDDRRRRRGRAARRGAGPRHARQDARRGAAGRGDRDDRRARGAGGGRPPPTARHLQRQPAQHGGRPREPPRGAHAGRLRGARAPGRADGRGLRGADRGERPRRGRGRPRLQGVRADGAAAAPSWTG